MEKNHGVETESNTEKSMLEVGSLVNVMVAYSKDGVEWYRTPYKFSGTVMEQPESFKDLYEGAHIYIFPDVPLPLGEKGGNFHPRMIPLEPREITNEQNNKYNIRYIIQPK